MQLCEECKHFQIGDVHVSRKDRLDYSKCLASVREDKPHIESLQRVGKFEDDPKFSYCVDLRKEDTCVIYERCIK